MPSRVELSLKRIKYWCNWKDIQKKKNEKKIKILLKDIYLDSETLLEK